MKVMEPRQIVRFKKKEIIQSSGLLVAAGDLFRPAKIER
jgi:hypothetical protein